MKLKNGIPRDAGTALGVSLGLHVLGAVLFLGFRVEGPLVDFEEKEGDEVFMQVLMPSTESKQAVESGEAPEISVAVDLPAMNYPISASESVIPTVVILDVNTPERLEWPREAHAGEEPAKHEPEGGGVARARSGASSGEASPSQSSSGPFEAAALLKMTSPAYPRDARRRGIEGTVTVRVEVSASGAAMGVSVAKSSGSRVLDEEALRSVRRWRFQAAKKGGVAVASAVLAPVVFRLE